MIKKFNFLFIKILRLNIIPSIIFLPLTDKMFCFLSDDLHLLHRFQIFPYIIIILK